MSAALAVQTRNTLNLPARGANPADVLERAFGRNWGKEEWAAVPDAISEMLFLHQDPDARSGRQFYRNKKGPIGRRLVKAAIDEFSDPIGRPRAFLRRVRA